MSNSCEACGDPVANLCPGCAEYQQAAQGQKSGIIGPNHALLVGQLLGISMEKEALIVGSIEGAADDNGDYENYFFINKSSGKWRVTITPEVVTEP